MKVLDGEDCSMYSLFLIQRGNSRCFMARGQKRSTPSLFQGRISTGLVVSSSLPAPRGTEKWCQFQIFFTRAFVLLFFTENENFFDQISLTMIFLESMIFKGPKFI